MKRETQQSIVCYLGHNLRRTSAFDLFTRLLFNLQQVDLQTLFHLSCLLLSCCLLRTQFGNLQEEGDEDVQKVKRGKTTAEEE